MIHIDIPEDRSFQIENLVLDYNGTLALDGKLIEGVEDRLNRLASQLRIHVVTADTFGIVERELNSVLCELRIMAPGTQDQRKWQYVHRLGAERTATIGNGRNDRLMLKKSALGIAVVQTEGAAVDALIAADIVVPNILDALDLFINPLRIKASLRT